MAAVSSESLPYPFKRSYKSSLRLNFNHFYMTRLTGYLLHPSISTDRNDLFVADIGTGTGIWASEVAAKLDPSTVVKAFDISDAQFPPQAWRSSNVHFEALDCFKPFPIEYHAKFDIVNLRFWLCIINDDVAEPLLENILTILKPGGYIQWFEAMPLSAHVKSKNHGASTPACDKLVKQWHKPSEHSTYEWVEGLPALMEKKRLHIIAKERYSNPDYYQPIGAQSFLAGIDEYLYHQQGDEFEKFQEQLAEEFSSGTFVDVSYTCVVGRKQQ